MSQRHETTSARIDKDLIVEARRKAGELTAQCGELVPVGAVLSASVKRGLAGVTIDDIRCSEPQAHTRVA